MREGNRQLFSSAMASLINKPLTSSSLCSSKTETPLLNRFRLGGSSVSFKNSNNFGTTNNRKVSFSVVCKAVSVEKQRQTDVQGLNIADDVTQVNPFSISVVFSSELLSFFSISWRIVAKSLQF